MPLAKITLRPGINVQATPTLNEGGYSAGNLVRFKDGLPQPVGGWIKDTSQTFSGTCRALHTWAQLDGIRNAALGTHSKLYLYQGNAFYDITPSGLAAGSVDASLGVGWGAGPWGSGSWGTPSGGSATVLQPRLWSLDHWGEELIANVRDGKIYRWRPADGSGTAATVLSGAPLFAKQILAGMPERHLIAFGAENLSGVQDPMLVRWSDVENYNIWTASAVNSAGSFRLNGGTQIMAARLAPQEILVWTDSALHSMQFVGMPYVYSFHQQGDACGLIGPNAATIYAGAAYWMGQGSFYTYAGAVRPLPCPVWDSVFGNLNRLQAWKCFAVPNSLFNEVWFFYPSTNSTEVDSYALYSVSEGTWSVGALARTAWIDVGVMPKPLATGANGVLYAHETGTDADGGGLDNWIESGWVDIADGQDFVFVDRVLPDFKLTGPVKVTLKTTNYPGATPTTKGPFTITTATRFINTRLRGRQMMLRIEADTAGAFWRLGALRINQAPDGQR